jgi:hypothetical protein
MIKFGDNDITGVFINNLTVVSVYKGAVLVWEAINSAFGAGYWANDRPWKNDDGWKN